MVSRTKRLFGEHKEEPLALRAASRRFPGEPSYASLKNWGRVGQYNKRTGQLITLDIFQIGGVWHTTEKAYQRFLDELNEEEEDVDDRPIVDPADQ